METGQKNQAITAFADSIHSTECARHRYPVWDALVEFRRCYRRMVVQSVHKHQGNKRCIVLHLNVLKTPHCEWIRGCSDMSDLRYFLAKYLQQLYGHRISQVGGVKIPQFDSQEKLSSDDIDNLLGCVKIWHGESAKLTGRKVCDEGHLSLHNGTSITHPEIPGEQILRSYPFAQLPFHSHVRQDFVAFLTPYCSIRPAELDLTNSNHVDQGVGYGRLICVFKCRTQVAAGHEVQEHHLAFIEELWPYTPRTPDFLMQHYGHKMLYSVKPGKVYYVFEISRLLGPASISRNPGMSMIPKGALTKNQQKLASGPHRKNHLAQEGCELFRLNMWIMKWGCKRHSFPIQTY